MSTKDYQKDRRRHHDYWLKEVIIAIDGSLDKFNESGYSSKQAYLNNRKKLIAMMNEEKLHEKK